MAAFDPSRACEQAVFALANAEGLPYGRRSD